MKADFSGYATKAGLKCSDGRTIMPEAFKHMDGMTVPLVWQHNGQNSPENVLGHAVLEARDDGVYAYGFFNDTDSAKNARALVEHKDINRMSIYANQLIERSKSVFHGIIREVSLVLAGANPGALIDFVAVQHADGETEIMDDEAVIYTGLELEHEDKPASKSTDKSKEDKNKKENELEHDTAKEIYESLTQEQKDVVHFMIGSALAEAKTNNSAEHGDEEGKGDMSRNVFEKDGKSDDAEKHAISHEDVKGIVADAIRCGSLKEAVSDYAVKHGIENIDIMFPDAKSVSATPEFDKRRTEWVSSVMNGTKHSPFSRIKSFSADLTHDEARAKGYVKGTLKKEEFFAVSKRVTTPTTIYKKQKLDRDDIIDITDFDVVSWLKAEMQLMLQEELAGAVLVGDGREVDDEDKIIDPAGATSGAGIRSISHDHELFAATINIASDATPQALVDAMTEAMSFYKGSGTPTFYTTLATLTKVLLVRDSLGRRIYRTASDVASEIGVSSIVTVDILDRDPGLVGIIVNLTDYTIGSDKGGDISMFDDFDIDYNQYKYLIETRLSGGLTKIRSAVIVRSAAVGAVDLVEPTDPTFDNDTGVVTIPTMAHVVYKNGDSGATLTAGAQTALTAGQTLNVIAVPASGFYFDNDVDDVWSFTVPN